MRESEFICEMGEESMVWFAKESAELESGIEDSVRKLVHLAIAYYESRFTRSIQTLIL